MKFPVSIKARITLWYVFILAIALCFLSIISYEALSWSLNDRIGSPFTLNNLKVTLAQPQDNGEAGYVRIASFIISEKTVQEINEGTESVFSTNSPFGPIAFEQNSIISPDTTGAQAVWVYGRPSEIEADKLELMIILQSVSASKNTLSMFGRTLWYTTPVAILLASILGFILIRRMLRPVDIIVRSAQGLGERDMRRRIPVASNDEMGRLASVLNQTFDRLQQAFDHERAFTADVSHGLNAPLAVIKGEATLALKNKRNEEYYRKTLDAITNEASQLTTLVHRLLVSSRLESGKEHLALQALDLKDLLKDFAEDLGVLCEQKEIIFSLNAPVSVIVQGDLTKLRELLLNLVGNAVKYSPEHGSVTVFLSSRNGYACIAIQDAGVGIAPEHLPHIFERFYRVDESISGTGLGLAICQSIAELHGGKIEVESQLGRGSKFTVLLPLGR